MSIVQNFTKFSTIFFQSSPTELPDCVKPALIRLGTGILYLSIYQVLTLWVPDMYPDSESFMVRHTFRCIGHYLIYFAIV